MQYHFTPAAERAISAAAGWTGREGRDDLQPWALLLGLLAESECRAAMILAASEIDAAAIRRQWPELRESAAVSNAGKYPLRSFSKDVEASLQAACHRLADLPQPLELATEHLLLGLAAAEHEMGLWLREHGLDPDILAEQILRRHGHGSGPLPLEPLPWQMDDASAVPCSTSKTVGPKDNRDEARNSEQEKHIRDQTPCCMSQDRCLPPAREGVTAPVLRVLDAAANRAREGIRTVEDYVRFVLDDRHLTDLCKQLRHDLTDALTRIPTEHRLAARETRADVGTLLTTSAEQHRCGAAEVLTANLVRLQEGLRSLEEFGKLVDPEMAAGLKRLRYRSYTLQRAVEITRSSLKRLKHARLYVLIDGRSSEDEFCRLVSSLIEVGVHVIQLRDKRLDDRTLLDRGRLLHELTADTDTLFVMNDRPDLAVLAQADGVHVGQEDLPVKDARTIVGPEALIGVSTHSIDQARQAVLDGANYIGVGPTFPSSTKQFGRFPGLDLLRAVAAEIRLPAFAIGGITRENLPAVLATGFARIAVSGAITSAGDPADAAHALLSSLQVEN